MKIKTINVFSLFLLLMFPVHAIALCTILCSCSVATSAVAFGTYNPLSAANLDGTGNVRVTCGGVLGLAVPYQIAINTGSNSVTMSPRKMASGANLLNYDLYTSNGYGTIWGDGSGVTLTVNGSITIVLLGGTFNDHPVSGRIPGNQSTVPPGNYSDAVTVTVTYF